MDAKLVMGSGKGRHGANIGGYRRDKFGYILPGIAASRVEEFNLTERGRIGLPVPRFIQKDDEGRIVAKWGSTA